MTATILLTGFGPFPGAPFNPTAPLVIELARGRIPGLQGPRRVAHVFPVSYAAVDHDLPMLLAHLRPDVLLMFGLASRRRHISIESRARNAVSAALPDVSGHRPAASVIEPGAGAALPLRAPVERLVAAVRAVGLAAARSGDAGSYLCNYLCWRAGEAAARAGGPRLVAFIHVPIVQMISVRGPAAPRLHPWRPRLRPPVTFDDLAHAGEAIMRAALP